MRMTPVKLLKKLYFWSTGYSYTNLGRLFLRLFVGIMLLQFGIRQIGHFHDICDTFPAALGMDSATTLIVMIVIEVVCSTFIMFGFITRLMIVPPFVTMVIGPGKISVDYFLSLHIIHSDNQSESQLEEV